MEWNGDLYRVVWLFIVCRPKVISQAMALLPYHKLSSLHYGNQQLKPCYNSITSMIKTDFLTFRSKKYHSFWVIDLNYTETKTVQ